MRSMHKAASPPGSWKSLKNPLSIKENFEFRRLYRKGKSAAGRLFILYARPRQVPGLRLGITVSVKVGGAVIRNRIRRRVRGVFRRHGSELKGGYDVIAVARGASAEADFSPMEEELFRLMDKLEMRA